MIEEKINQIEETLHREFSLIKLYWKVYKNVYSVDEEQIELLNSFDPNFFGIVQRIYLDQIILMILKLNEKSHKVKNANMTLKQYYSKAKDKKDKIDKETSEYIESLFKKISKRTTKMVIRRNKIIAHLDYKYSISISKRNEASYTINQIEETLENMEDILNLLNSKLGLDKRDYNMWMVANDRTDEIGKFLVNTLKEIVAKHKQESLSP